MRVIEIDQYGARLKNIENTLESLQTAVGGYIEPLKFTMGGFTMLLDEEGALVPKYLNLIASDVAGEPIHGKAIILCTKNEEFTDVSAGVIKSLGRYMRVRYNINIEEGLYDAV